MSRSSEVERRPYFVFGDVLSCAVIGAIAALAATASVAEWWNMIVGMLVGMTVGMLVGMTVGMVVALLVGFALFVGLFGAMEVMLPTMLTGMLAGMAFGMVETMRPLGSGAEAGVGALIGCAVLALTYLANARLSGRATVWTP